MADLVALLGVTMDETPLAKPINEFLVERWKNGLPTEQRTEVLKKYPHPENFPLLVAPNLNVEMESVISQPARARDSLQKTSQGQLAAVLAILGQLVTDLMIIHDSQKPQEILNIDPYIKQLSDAARLCADLFHGQSSLTKRLLAHSPINPMARTFIAKSTTDTLLLGSDFSEKWEVAKESEKQARRC